MVTKEQLKDWLNKKAREDYFKELESYIDNEIKHNALNGKTTFYISTAEYGFGNETFNKLWYTDKLSKENREQVHKDIINAYREAGFDVTDEGFALKFSQIDKILDD